MYQGWRGWGPKGLSFNRVGHMMSNNMKREAPGASSYPAPHSHCLIWYTPPFQPLGKSLQLAKSMVGPQCASSMWRVGEASIVYYSSSCEVDNISRLLAGLPSLTTRRRSCPLQYVDGTSTVAKLQGHCEIGAQQVLATCLIALSSKTPH